MTQIKKQPQNARLLLNLGRDEYWCLLGLLGTVNDTLQSPMINNIYKKVQNLKLGE